MDRVRKICSLSRWDLQVLGQAWILFLILELGLRLLPFKTVLRYCRAAPSRKRQASPTSPPVSRIAWLVHAAGRLSPFKVTCLKQALVLTALLGRRGYPSHLRIGVSRQDGSFRAHAWLESDGQIMFGHSVDRNWEPLFP